jgi:hypothetical protein
MKTDRLLGWAAVTISPGNGIVWVVWRSLSRYFDSCLNWAGSCSSSLPVYSPCFLHLTILSTMLWVGIRYDPLGFCVCMCIDFLDFFVALLVWNSDLDLDAIYGTGDLIDLPFTI